MSPGYVSRVDKMKDFEELNIGKLIYLINERNIEVYIGNNKTVFRRDETILERKVLGMISGMGKSEILAEVRIISEDNPLYAEYDELIKEALRE